MELLEVEVSAAEDDWGGAVVVVEECEGVVGGEVIGVLVVDDVGAAVEAVDVDGVVDEDEVAGGV